MLAEQPARDAGLHVPRHQLDRGLVGLLQFRAAAPDQKMLRDELSGEFFMLLSEREHVGDPAAQHRPRRAGLAQPFRGRAQAPQQVQGDLDEQRLLILEVEIKQAFGDAGLARYGVHLKIVVGRRLKRPLRRAQDLAPPDLGVLDALARRLGFGGCCIHID